MLLKPTQSGSNLTRLFPLTKQAIDSLLQAHSSCPTQLMQAHALLLTTGLSIKNSLITRLLENFIMLGDMSYARKLFDELHKPRAYLWNTLIKGYVKYEIPCQAVTLYRDMHGLGVRPDPFTFPFVVKACAEFWDVWVGAAVHAVVLKYGLEFIAMVRTELMMMYVKYGELSYAEKLFFSMEDRDLVSWNALISAYAQNGYAVNALRMFHEMRVGGINPDGVTIVSALSACSQLGCLETAEKIYEFGRREGRVEGNVFIDNARLDVYVKCGCMDMAFKLFNRMPYRNVISWSTMIGGYALNGESGIALKLFSRMKYEGVQPNSVTYLGVLCACSHAGLVEEGWNNFNNMTYSDNCNLKPRKEHYACMVDLLGRSGRLEEAYNFITTMPIEPDAAVWAALLGACSIYHNIDMGQHAADMLFELSPDIASYHVLVSNMYAAAGRWKCVAKVRHKMRKKGVKKVAAYSSIEYNGQIHILYAGDRWHPQMSRIYQNLKELIERIKTWGYSPKSDSVLHDVDEEEREETLSTHSEKLAIVFGLINIEGQMPIRVIKNLRTCDDCHTFAKIVSKMTMREIIMRDKSRFHHFKHGSCSCKDFW
ncbi:hypothetical protein DCAR_0832820 [Daucus carota subsp. sativus]|uniref:DYW domain-containing protein n=1 Tax=Daucus carota subsp. sativus TaxID=79200 RepID=A0AAF1BF15_DAUCS|nr:PREDICTED: pentatricopeptide repeat-containing protein At2g01510, mitochondrial [Daucus carota subsp. sativus]WOH13311.1 hypothetical protein DCAR_0832820 [Daucus carota subsp. sativus]